MRAAILLAAGASRRMGRPKLELALGGEAILERSVRNLLDAAIDRLVVVVAAGGGTLLKRIADERLEVVENPARDGGLASSLALGARHLPPDVETILIALADKPLVKAETIRTVIEAFERSHVRVAYPLYRGVQGHPVLLAPDLVPELLQLRGDRGAKTLLSRYRSDALEIPVEDAGVCIDIDTPEDYAKARDALR